MFLVEGEVQVYFGEPRRGWSSSVDWDRARSRVADALARIGFWQFRVGQLGGERHC